MGYSLQDFTRDTREILKAGSSRAQVDKVKAKMEQLLVDPGFVKQYFGTDQPLGLKRIHIDPTGFEVMTYRYNEARKSNPHDHGDSWAIYGQATSYTDMAEYERVDDRADPGKARLEVRKKYRLNPGQAGIFQDGAIHSIDYPDGSRFVRVTGTNLDRIARSSFDPKTGAVKQMAPQRAT